MTKVLILLGVVGGLASARADERFDAANADFEAGRFGAAAQAYEQLLADGPRAAVLQNLGSAYFRQEDYGRAILAFERALLLDPGNPDLEANLKLARDEAAVFPVASGDGWNRFLAKLSRQQWSVLALGCAFALPLAAGAWVVFRKRRRVGVGAAACGIPAVGLLVLSLHALDAREGEEERAIVVAAPATVRISPFATADERASLANGREVKLGRLENGYFWITMDGGGTEGWVTAGEVGRVIPRAGDPGASR
ncbi:tetratricopeptide repeat protein [Luteolibacter marinus]|uniref:tetratricopeptide repeat protein n=1 Tax=Luteolibacter marinus TaxID=2776705 RepID=UPI001865EE0A|nr:tetratricopeptide repeat protein [Luteolibacter marinus]